MLKSFLFGTIILSSAMAMAGEFTVMGKIHFQGASSWVPANLVCSDGINLYHKKKASLKTSCHGDNKGDCKPMIKPYVQPVHSSKAVCVKDNSKGCTKYAEVPYTQGTVRVEVYRNESAWDKGQHPIRTYKYTVDDCREL